MSEVEPVARGVIMRSSPWLCWTVSVLCCVLSAYLPEYFGSWPSWLPVELATGVVSLVSLEVVGWRAGLRPRIEWTQRHVVVRYTFRDWWLEWPKVSWVGGQGNTIEISTVTGDHLVWDFDHFSWLARLSRRYASRADRNRHQLSTAWQRFRDGPNGVAEPAIGAARRPLWLFAALTAGAVVLSSVVS